MLNKISDNEIKKALECSVNGKCPECPYFHSYPCDKCRNMRKDALDLINRQKEEIERLKNTYKQVAWERDIFAEDMKQEIKKDCSYLMLDIKTIKAEAYKEFAERLKKKTYPFPCAVGVENAVTVRAINDLVKEMVGEE